MTQKKLQDFKLNTNKVYYVVLKEFSSLRMLRTFLIITTPHIQEESILNEDISNRKVKQLKSSNFTGLELWIFSDNNSPLKKDST
mmetsp:Transcript_11986/g.17785  ORF Transcript_11986/g.17785 Transcript_11986/m.17785 type:complete len:85 (-) Transcript_11986:6-260(-)